MAAQENHVDVVSYLLANGASQDITTEVSFYPSALCSTLFTVYIIGRWIKCLSYHSAPITHLFDKSFPNTVIH